MNFNQIDNLLSLIITNISNAMSSAEKEAEKKDMYTAYSRGYHLVVLSNTLKQLNTAKTILKSIIAEDRSLKWDEKLVLRSAAAHDETLFQILNQANLFPHMITSTSLSHC